MLGKIQAVCGFIEPEDLGYCDTHGHIFVNSEHIMRANSPEYFAVNSYRSSAEELLDFKAFGGNAVVDAQPIGTGRVAREMRNLSMETGVQIIAATGFHQRSFYPDEHWILDLSEDELAELFASELREGMLDYCEACKPGVRTDIRAGIIKCATKGETLNALQTKLLAAAASASVETGAPIMCHTEDGSEECSLKFLIAHGVPADSIIAAHTDRRDNQPPKSFDRAYALGAYISFDTFGADYYRLEVTVQRILDELEKGREDRMLLGLDPMRTQLRAYSGGIGMRYIPETLLPRLRESGVGEAIITKLTRSNPARILSFYK